MPDYNPLPCSQTPKSLDASNALQSLQIIIQARMTSTRLPEKVMMKMANKPMLEWLIERLAPLKQHIIVATTNDGSEAPIVALCQKLGVGYFQGSTDDVLGRYYFAAKAHGATKETAVIRITSDCPLVDVKLVQQSVNEFNTGQYDMVSLGPHSGYPRGLDACIFGFELLEKTHLIATSAADREHVTLGMGKVQTINNRVLYAEQDLTHFRLTLDEADDFKAIERVFQLMNYQTDFDYPALEKVLLAHPEIAEINRHVEQKNA
ncbi:polysaccharide biosynthesis protein [Thalassotalea euphylliae]|uniref:Polysaccharide biosynthesis protein n=1 Tax=Thalassotalea euphylliae TaxID=1655234 RepID=A0A3E0TP39_9GAMM|nr:glycosyltransferase family protein [Thalassotalea euphylliae]REL26060.1 polysaccharide biosynthesis protein [Thalassotalea euphylliae]